MQYKQIVGIFILVSHKDLKLRNNTTLFEELSVSIVDLTAANAVLLAT